jgi:hypothetical protein
MMPHVDKTSPRARFFQHKSNAQTRGIVFSLTFDQWWSLWETYWDGRGKGAGKNVMCRVGDRGGYTPGNVYIATQEHNGSVKVAVRPHSKLQEDDIPRVRDLIKVGVGARTIGNYFGVSRNAIRQIDNGKTWRTS